MVGGGVGVIHGVALALNRRIEINFVPVRKMRAA
jgi:hypothetical protein